MIRPLCHVLMHATKPLLLLAGAPALVALTIFIAAMVLGRIESSLKAILYLMALYWLGCWILTLTGAPRTSLWAMFRTSPSRRPLDLCLTWIPSVATFAAVFLVSAPHLSPLVLTVIYTL